ncbi:cytochrome P450 [Polyangium sp. 15x6]|uniref:cytochrome P450 n=1 Tax=Polyangium sp. 15x6 TaxID=3042687 RepID=UPI00249C93A6|nr:cytochrome P450 [Polyangium sp. 15x6]MDI3284393.1 cytochrome P450 [Polyangium sp. 15x6]
MQTRSPLPPGPAEPPFLQAMRFGRDPYAYLEECVRRYGDVFTLRLPGDPPRVVSSDPVVVRQIFALKPDDYAQGLTSFPMNIGENSLLFLDGDRHHRERQLMMPHLHGERLRSYAASMCAAADKAVDRWTSGAELAIHGELQDITLDVILRCVFGAGDDFRAARIRGPLLTWLNGSMTPALFFASALLNANRVRAMLDTVVRRRLAGGPVPRRPLLPWEKWGAAKAEVLEYLREDVERCRKEGTKGRSDVLALLAEARYDDGEPMAMEQVQDELVTLLVGGHETTANTLSWTLYHVLSRPEVLSEIRAEMKRVFGDEPFDPTRAGELVYLDACIKEAMRISPIAPAVGRHLKKPMKIRDYDIPPDTIVWACTALAHRRTDTWGDPMRYRPERFLEAGAAPTNHFFPFGGGRRTCLGMAFAGVEMRIVLARILERTELRIAPGSVVQAEIRGITITPSKGFKLSVERRLPSRSS